nr:uncharacterized protein LOC109152893 isoform X2 [Ipomoea batatas]
MSSKVTDGGIQNVRHFALLNLEALSLLFAPPSSMAEKTDFDSRPGQISKDMHGSGPLSPQWLFPKSGENKTGIATGENHFNPHSVYPGGSEPPKSPVMGEDVHDHQKKKEVFRPSVMDVESARRDRWREEERDTNSSIRRDRWREGDKGLGDGRKVDRWTDSAGRHYGEGRRVPVERFSDTGNRESSHDQRRESKWNTRWGPDNKEVDGLREKWSDFSKDDDFPIEKGPSGLAYHGKDEREGDHYRPWRPNASQSRGRIPSVGSSMNDVSSHIPSHSVLAEKVESGHDESFSFKEIENGEVLSSGAPQINKVTVLLVEIQLTFLQSRRNKQAEMSYCMVLMILEMKTIDNGRGGHSDGFYDRQLALPLSPMLKLRLHRINEKFLNSKLNTEGVWRSTINSDIMDGLRAGYFGIDLLVRLVGHHLIHHLPNLGMFMPHLRAKARPPPGFGFWSRSSSGSTSNAPPEEVCSISEGYIGNYCWSICLLWVLKVGIYLYLLAKKIALERAEISTKNPYSYWPGRDVASIVPTSDVIHDSLPHSKLPLVADNWLANSTLIIRMWI